MELQHSLNGNGCPTLSNGPSAAFLVVRPQVDFERVQWLGRELLLAIGEDPDRDGLKETPPTICQVVAGVHGIRSRPS